jgi:elongation factor P
MASLIEAIEIKRKMFFEFENAPYHCLEVEVSRPTARGGQTLVRIKMRNLLTQAVFDKTFKAGEKFKEPDLVMVQVHKYNGNPIGVVFPPHVELKVASTEPGVRGDTASGGVTKAATLETGLEVRVPLFIKEGEKVKVHTETREFAGRA